ncbi:MAG: LacI family DNA-binding transcriptional regulator [Candidatus Omnitrophica bacterium]|nr:LacI family DNA-binding transcriptional regulator [Candidatus Omnitrophota bacterium]
MNVYNKKISIEDVARRAKVSITTVSRVINNVPTVSAKNRAKVEEAIVHLKFKPNVSAQRLARGYNNSIGLVMPGYPGIFYSFYAVELIRGVGHACEIKGLDLVFHITNGDNPINTSNVGGIIFADVIENKKQVESAIAMGTPCLIINNRVDDLNVNYIAIDNKKGGRIAADYLVSLGHKKIATITGNLNTQAGLHRFEGFKKFLKEKDIDLPEKYLYRGDYSRRCARAAAQSFLELPEPPTAIFAASDEMALEAVTVIMEKGLRIPEDISIIGFDDNPACLFGPVALTTIKQLLFKMAEDSVHLLSSIIAGKDKVKKKSVLTPELVVRESCGPCRA